MKLSHKFVKNIPELNHLEDGMLYVSIDYSTAIHKCCCGCGSEIVTPLSPDKWKLIFDGKTVSIYPSIGNWDYPCRSHYWITNNEIDWAPKWSREEVEHARIKEVQSTETHKKKGLRSLLEILYKKGD